MPVQCSRVSSPEMMLGYKLAAAGATAAAVGGVVTVRKALANRKDPAVESFRASLGSMEQLSALSEMKLETGEKVGRVAGVWKEYIKSDGRKWYYNTETSIMQWKVPDEYKVLDEVAAAAAAANEARGT